MGICYRQVSAISFSISSTNSEHTVAGVISEYGSLVSNFASLPVVWRQTANNWQYRMTVLKIFSRNHYWVRTLNFWHVPYSVAWVRTINMANIWLSLDVFLCLHISVIICTNLQINKRFSFAKLLHPQFLGVCYCNTPTFSIAAFPVALSHCVVVLEREPKSKPCLFVRMKLAAMTRGVHPPRQPWRNLPPPFLIHVTPLPLFNGDPEVSPR